MRAYYNYLRTQYTKINWRLYGWVLNFPLVFSKITNNYGKSWLLPILWIFGSAAFNFLLIKLTQGFEPLFDYRFAEFLIPTHDIFLVACKTAVNLSGAVAIDIGHRIWEGMLIFQLIRAFRFYQV